MIVGILKEIKSEENRVCMTPAGVEIMKQNGHLVLVENNAGTGSGLSNGDYMEAGAQIVDSAQVIYAKTDMVMHVKEPQPSEYELIREDQILFTYLHLAANLELTESTIETHGYAILCSKRCKYETSIEYRL